jgi:hypothetical protein
MTRIARVGAVLALALLTALALAGPATAKKKPGKDKRAQSAKVLPKKWAKKYKAKSAQADPDRDGLTNWGEYRSHTKPKKTDSDKDGIGDAQEDYDRDGVDNGTELDARTDPGRKDTDRDGTKDGAEDPDKDRLTNAAEDTTGNHPRKADTDGDGIADGDENAGTVTAFDGTTLTIALAVGGALTGTVDELTDVACEEDETAFEDEGDFGDDEDEFGEDELGEEELEEEDPFEDAAEGFAVKAHLAEEGDEDDLDDEEWFDEGCSADIAPGTAVREAEIEGGVFVALELVL